MKVAVISSTVFPCPPTGYAGLELVALQTAEGLAKRGHDVVLYAPDGSHSDVCAVRHFGPPGRISEEQAYSGYWHELPQYDVCVDHSWEKNAYVLKMEGKLPQPILGVLHAPVNTMYASLPPVEKPCMVCLSKDQASHFESLFERPCEVAYNAIDPNYYKAIPGVDRSDRFLFLARFSSIKGPLLAIEACKAVGAKLDLIGDTSITNEPEYFRHCQSLCDGERIRLIGPASRGECVRWFSQALAMIHPTRDFREPFGLAPLESQACGAPVIAWNRGALKETVLDGETGWLVNSTDELAGIIDAVNRHGIEPKMRDKCRQNALSYTPERLAERYDQLIHQAVETGGW